MWWSTQTGPWTRWPTSAWPAPPPRHNPKPPKRLPPVPSAPALQPPPKNHFQRSFQGLEDQQPGFRLPLLALRRVYETPAWVWGWQEPEDFPSTACGRAVRRPSRRSKRTPWKQCHVNKHEEEFIYRYMIWILWALHINCPRLLVKLKDCSLSVDKSL